MNESPAMIWQKQPNQEPPPKTNEQDRMAGEETQAHHAEVRQVLKPWWNLCGALNYCKTPQKWAVAEVRMQCWLVAQASSLLLHFKSSGQTCNCSRRRSMENHCEVESPRLPNERAILCQQCDLSWVVSCTVSVLVGSQQWLPYSDAPRNSLAKRGRHSRVSNRPQKGHSSRQHKFSPSGATMFWSMWTQTANPERRIMDCLKALRVPANASDAIPHNAFFPERIAKGSSGKSLEHWHFYTYTHTPTLPHLHLNTDISTRTLEHLRFHTYTWTWTWTLTLLYVPQCKWKSESIQRQVSKCKSMQV